MQKVDRTAPGPSLFHHASVNGFYLTQSRKDRKGKIFSPPVLLRATREHRGSREERLSQRRGVEVLFGFLLANESKQYFKVSALLAADTQ